MEQQVTELGRKLRASECLLSCERRMVDLAHVCSADTISVARRLLDAATMSGLDRPGIFPGDEADGSMELKWKGIDAVVVVYPTEFDCLWAEERVQVSDESIMAIVEYVKGMHRDT